MLDNAVAWLLKTCPSLFSASYFVYSRDLFKSVKSACNQFNVGMLELEAAIAVVINDKEYLENCRVCIGMGIEIIPYRDWLDLREECRL